jgi:hypothetical protein
MSLDCGPMVSTQPKTMSSTSAGSIPVALTSAAPLQKSWHEVREWAREQGLLGSEWVRLHLARGYAKIEALRPGVPCGPLARSPTCASAPRGGRRPPVGRARAAGPTQATPRVEPAGDGPGATSRTGAVVSRSGVVDTVAGTA